MWTRNVALVMIGVLSGMVAWLFTTWCLHRPEPPLARAPIVEDAGDPRGAIEGIVTTAGQPRANVRVCANTISPRVLAIEPLPRCTQTDAAGRYTFGALLPGAYRIVTARAGRDLTVMPDERRQGIDLVTEGPGLATASM